MINKSTAAFSALIWIYANSASLAAPAESRSHETSNYWQVAQSSRETYAAQRMYSRHGVRTRKPQEKEKDELYRAPYVDEHLSSTTPLFSEATKQALRNAIERYTQIVVEGGWKPVPKGIMLRPDVYDEGVRYLRKRLQLTGDLAPHLELSRTFDSRVEQAVKRYQLRNGLKPTGRVDRRTLAMLNITADRRLAQLRLNLVRLNSESIGDDAERYVLVNIPAFMLQAVNGSQIEMVKRVIVGKPTRQSPVVSAKISALNFYPYWHVPESVARLDLIPRIQREPEYFFDNHFQLFTTWGGKQIDTRTVDWFSPETANYKFRQDRGPFNALGILRIDMPNKHSVYMHDTPLKKRFKDTFRAYSAGCVRVHNVLDLAEWILAGHQEWDGGRIRLAANSGIDEDVKLEKKIPVHFRYITAWATEDGTAHFRYDIYNRDGIEGIVASYRAPKDAEDDVVAP